jgi:hypothetical protein
MHTQPDLTAKLRLLQTAFSVLLIAASGNASARAASIILNGGFESGFTNWTTVDETGGTTAGWQIQTGTLSPINMVTVPAPPQGLHAAMTDSGGPGSHALLQSFVVAPNSSATLTFDLFVANQAAFSTPASLDFNVIPNQQARIDILTGATTVANAFSLSSVADNVLDPSANTVAYSQYSFDITSAVSKGGTFTLRFAEVDNQNIFNLGVDNVAIVTAPLATPEPTSQVQTAIAAYLLVAFAAARRRARSGPPPCTGF